MQQNYQKRDKSPCQPKLMQFKTDENLPTEVAELLTVAGYDTKTVNDQGLRGIKDNILVAKCTEENRILITLDTDFSNIKAYPPEEFHGIIVLRVSSYSKKHILSVIQRAMKSFRKEPIERNLWIIEETRIRIRSAKE